jgi:hypothetical protein
LDCLDDFRKGTAARRHNSIRDAMKEANSTLPLPFADYYIGEPNPIAQKIAMEVKLTDAVFAATLAPYNRGLSNARPFAEAPMNDLPRALTKFLFVTLQRNIFGNQAAQFYFCSRSARVWELENPGGLGKPNPPLLPAQRKWKLWRDIVITQGKSPSPNILCFLAFIVNIHLET